MRVVCEACKKARSHHAKGLCQKCYNESDHHRNAQKKYSETDNYRISMAKCHMGKVSFARFLTTDLPKKTDGGRTCTSCRRGKYEATIVWKCPACGSMRIGKGIKNDPAR